MYSLDHETATLGFLHESTRVVGSCMHTTLLYRVKINLEKTKQETKKKMVT